MESYNSQDFFKFINESFRIEGLSLGVEEFEYENSLMKDFLNLDSLTIKDLDNFVNKMTAVTRYKTFNGQMLRKYAGMNVRVGDYIAPEGGSSLMESFEDLLTGINNGSISASDAHVQYERLHPFMDGNGRSGRALWLWIHAHADCNEMFLNAIKYGFLHCFITIENQINPTANNFYTLRQYYYNFLK